ncbi:hypothetical protein [Pseudomonas aeruginosa]|uniref:hypothetical protein n=1 Tax=Pseudomonas aeruginosa TaxID=287 RepID=UPI000A79B8A9|nr:hypothetical protein [Pseudomonas aeruginosa]MBG4039921.1 hypothetical protein [Pseudomonas aeruginosa]MBG6953646.1 hypothetical protein [Pseudomonas aeruginosa]MXU53526.1 hypothetical protein [Pseudomonas aeruginosa]QKZ53248.1 hypothetical protein HWN43_25360 [Pseudomonas aeruginosa]HBN9847973.1 hypothetical protein [Pseudomonas aeruginosa]
MKVLAVLNKSELALVGEIEKALSGMEYSLDILEFKKPYNFECVQREEIASRLAGSDVLVYFGSRENEGNKCIDGALVEAARLNVKVICIWLDAGAELAAGFESLGDALISDISALSGAITQQQQEWQNSDGTLRDDRPFKRYKCGNKK